VNVLMKVADIARLRMSLRLSLPIDSTWRLGQGGAGDGGGRQSCIRDAHHERHPRLFTRIASRQNDRCECSEQGIGNLIAAPKKMKRPNEASEKRRQRSGSGSGSGSGRRG
jgi:hypothetical protein